MSLRTENKREYTSWRMMRHRCLNPKFTKYPYYGGRGIKICAEWIDSFENFLADMGKRPEGKTLDRKDNDGDYTPENCRWATQQTQVQNSTRCVLSDNDVLVICNLAELGKLTHQDIADSFGVARSTVTNILLGNTRHGFCETSVFAKKRLIQESTRRTEMTLT